MRTNSLAIRQIENRFRDIDPNLYKLEKGWIRQIREALGMTMEKLGKVCDLSTSTISQAERGESQGKITVDTLKKTAEAMNCEFIYMFIPKSEMTEFIEQKAYEKAKRILMSADLHMSLEGQKVTGDLEPRIQRLKKKLIDEGNVW
jgi:predicted DNA-binding mobile mystery protein A